jgi:hypothetical protein
VNCTARCDSFYLPRGLIHTTFHNIQRVIIHQDDSSEHLYAALTEGAPWLSVSMEPRAMKDVLSNFLSLQQIVMHRKSREQLSEVRDGQVFAAESGMLMRGRADWSPNLWNRGRAKCMDVSDAGPVSPIKHAVVRGVSCFSVARFLGNGGGLGPGFKKRVYHYSLAQCKKKVLQNACSSRAQTGVLSQVSKSTPTSVPDANIIVYWNS